MKQIKFSCDECAKKTQEIIIMHIKEGEITNQFTTIDLCQNCYNRLFDSIPKIKKIFENWCTTNLYKQKEQNK